MNVSDVVHDEMVKFGENYAGQREGILTFPDYWTPGQCDKYAADRCLSVWKYSWTSDGRRQYHYAWSWRLDYQKQFGSYPTKCLTIKRLTI